MSEAGQEGVDQAPKIFVSYRWSSPEHEEWVLRLATSLRTNGVDVRLDKWHLKEGQDTLAFMESMVNDPTVKKVLLICDAGYVERANSREGGVGTEAQIISAKVYKDTDQDKFAAIVVDLNDLGYPILPTYMSTRLYFDMSSADAEAANFEKVVRWIFGQPFHAMPPIGAKPDFVGKTYVTGSPLFKIGAPAIISAGRSIQRKTPIASFDRSLKNPKAFIWNLWTQAMLLNRFTKGSRRFGLFLRIRIGHCDRLYQA